MKNWIIVLLVFAIPLGLYGFLNSQNPIETASFAKKIEKAAVYKFTSPMCNECKNVTKMLEGMPEKHTMVIFKEVNVGGGNHKKGEIKELIDKYQITTVPTVVFIDKNGNLHEKLEVDMTKEQIEKNVREISGEK